MDSPCGWTQVDLHMWDKGVHLVPEPQRWSLTLLIWGTGGPPSSVTNSLCSGPPLSTPTPSGISWDLTLVPASTSELGPVLRLGHWRPSLVCTVELS